MKLQAPLSPSADRGVALVIVLAIVVLLTGLIVAFFSSVTNEASTTRASIDQGEADVIADSAVQMAINQIRSATQPVASDDSTITGLTWASQPGAIRTFQTNGTLHRVYKLYSSDKMSLRISGSQWDPSTDLPSGEWRAKDKQNVLLDYSATWADMNSPVSDTNGNAVFPILDPDAQGNVKGFDFDVNTVTGTTTSRLPMPVKWIYLLKTGDPVSASGGVDQITVNKTLEANKTHGGLANVITARMAFWTDDETSKVNINTAAGGVYWDTPRADTSQEQMFGDRQPALKEFQRYPGHPATVSLSTVFPVATDNDIYDIVPRVARGGSNGGTSRTNVSGGASAVTPDGDRLYASVDELLYAVTNRDENPVITPDTIEQSRFFLTAHSRAPEVTLFGTPRITTWPIYKDHLTTNPTRVTGFDSLSAFCGTVGGYPYYFQRESPTSPTNDISIARNTQLLNYLTRLTGATIPGFGGDFQSKYTDDRDQILTQIFDYVRSTNLYDGNLATGSQYTYPTASINSAGVDHTPGWGWVVPSQRTTGTVNTMGFGRTVTLSEMGIAFIANAQADDPATAATDESGGSNTVESPRNPAMLTFPQRRIQAMFMPEFFAPMVGWAGIHPYFTLRVEGLEQFQVNGESLGFPASADFDNDASWNFYGGRRFGGGLWRAFAFSTTWGRTYPFVSQRVVIDAPGAAPTMDFTGGVITVTLIDKASGATIQQIKALFPDATGASAFPAPSIVNSGTVEVNGGQSSPTAKEVWWGFQDGGGQRLQLAYKNPGFGGQEGPGQIIRQYDTDVVRSIIPRHGDFRIIAGSHEFDDSAGTVFVKHPEYENPGAHLACSFSHAGASNQDIANGTSTHETGRNFFSNLPDLGTSQRRPDIYPDAPAADRPEATGDFDTGIASSIDGAYLNKPDEGSIHRSGGTGTPYFDSEEQFESVGATFFSPNRIMPSAGMFGSLPTGVIAGQPWQTLLFRPQTTHPSHSTTIPDHLMLDLFWMPVVEPYAISEPLSTAGKINLNYQIAPFTHIDRATALHALLSTEKVAAIPDANAADYKTGAGTATFRKDVDIDETLKQFDDLFDDDRIFRSATEICDIHIVPDDPSNSPTATTMANYWSSHRLTSDNLRERIYTTLYPRLTTKSNVFTVHYRVQALKQAPRGNNANPDWYEWDEQRDQVMSEQRGSVTIERYIDPNEPNLPDFATDTTANIDDYYRFRVINHKRFAP